MRASVLVALLCVSSFASAQSEPFEFKGIALGSELAAIESNPRFECRDPNNPIADRSCRLRYRENETIAGAPVRTLSLNFYNGKLHAISISFDAANFSQVAAALNEKYGAGSLKTEQVQNRMGATFENKTYSWRKPGATLSVEQLSGQIDRSSVLFRTDAAAEEFARRRGSSAKEKAKDL